LIKSLALSKITEEDKYSHLAPLKVETNDYNLNIPRYVDTFEEEEAIDLKAITTELRELAVLAIRQMPPLKVLYRTRNRNPF
jgi:type I restriction-modification system DNA methylase subunit